MVEHYELDEVTLFSAFAVGVPGKRTFFLATGHKEDWVRVWLEKEQLEALALAIDQLLFTISQEHHRSPREAEGPSMSDDVPTGMPKAELETDQMTLGFDQERATLNILVHASGPQKVDWTELSCRATLAQLKKLSKQAKSLCAAGRPRCVFCGGPIDPEGHSCPKNN